MTTKHLRRFSAFPEVLDITDLRLREFKMAVTGKSLMCIQIVLKHSTEVGFADILTDV